MNTILIDFHGVLTDGRMSILCDGTQLFEHVHTRDVRAIRELIARGYHVVIVTASSSPIIRAFADKVGAEVVVSRIKRNIARDYIAVGDDAWDVAMLENAAEAYCPADADISVRRLPNVRILKTNGGKGVIAELLSELNKGAACAPSIYPSKEKAVYRQQPRLE